MPIDYDKIVEGRRRNWESLKPEEIREQEREAQRERLRKEREEKGKEGFFARRQRLKDEAAAEDRKRFRRSLRQSVVMVGGLLLIAGVYLGITHLIQQQREAALRRSLEEVQALVANGTIVLNTTTPVQAFGTWRSAWKRGDVPTMVKMLSPRYINKATDTKSVADLMQEYERLYREGRLEPVREITLDFETAVAVRVPLPPYRNEELALFKSGEVTKSRENGPPKQYIVALSYNRADKQWYFADVREAKYFSVKWYMEAMIRPMRIGPGATIYTEEGNPIQDSPSRMRPQARGNQRDRRPPPVTLK